MVQYNNFIYAIRVSPKNNMSKLKLLLHNTINFISDCRKIAMIRSYIGRSKSSYPNMYLNLKR